MSRLFSFLIISLLVGCAALDPRFEPPVVSVNNLQILPSNSLSPRFLIDLKVINPNSQSLDIKGAYYSIEIEGHQVISGVSNKLPVIAGYDEANIELIASADLLGGLKLLNDLLSQNRQGLSYLINVKLDMGRLALPINVTREGKVDFTHAQR